MSAPQEKPVPFIDTHLVRQLIAQQFPQWRDLPVTPVVPGDWDNRTLRLGGDTLVRLPSAPAYVDQVIKEQAWLPKLAAQLSLPIPAPIALGAPAAGYPGPWSVYGWLDGESACDGGIADMAALGASWDGAPLGPWGCHRRELAGQGGKGARRH